MGPVVSRHDTRQCVERRRVGSKGNRQEWLFATSGGRKSAATRNLPAMRVARGPSWWEGGGLPRLPLSQDRSQLTRCVHFHTCCRTVRRSRGYEGDLQLRRRAFATCLVGQRSSSGACDETLSLRVAVGDCLCAGLDQKFDVLSLCVMTHRSRNFFRREKKKIRACMESSVEVAVRVGCRTGNCNVIVWRSSCWVLMTGTRNHGHAGLDSFCEATSLSPHTCKTT